VEHDNGSGKPDYLDVVSKLEQGMNRRGLGLNITLNPIGSIRHPYFPGGITLIS